MNNNNNENRSHTSWEPEIRNKIVVRRPRRLFLRRTRSRKTWQSRIYSQYDRQRKDTSNTSSSHDPSEYCLKGLDIFFESIRWRFFHFWFFFCSLWNFRAYLSKRSFVAKSDPTFFSELSSYILPRSSLLLFLCVHAFIPLGISSEFLLLSVLLFPSFSYLSFLLPQHFQLSRSSVSFCFARLLKTSFFFPTCAHMQLFSNTSFLFLSCFTRRSSVSYSRSNWLNCHD